MTSGGRAKDIFSTHDAAKICRVTPMTVIRWIKEGKIPAFKTAGGHRRILRSDLVRFCKARGIPFPLEAEPEAWRVLVADGEPSTRHAVAEIARRVDDKLLIELAGDAWSAGQLLATFRPNLVFLDATLPGIDPLEITARLTRGSESEPPAVAVLVAQGTPDGERVFRSRGAIGYLKKPPQNGEVERVVRATFQLPDVTAGETPSIHIVEADPRAARQMRRDLEERLPGCRVTTFETAVEAVFAMSAEPPAVLVMDLDEVDLTATELLRRICARGGQPAFPVLAVGAAEALRAAALGAGARSFLIKPYLADDIIDVLHPTAAGSPRPARKRK
jgi:excisionase family DNA binding protein